MELDPPRDKMVSLRLQSELVRKLSAEAKREGRSLSSFIERVLAKHAGVKISD